MSSFSSRAAIRSDVTDTEPGCLDETNGNETLFLSSRTRVPCSSCSIALVMNCLRDNPLSDDTAFAFRKSWSAMSIVVRINT